MNAERQDIIELLTENKYFAVIEREWTHHVYDDNDYICGSDTDKMTFDIEVFDNAQQMEDRLSDLSVEAGESEGNFHFRILMANPPKYWEEAKREAEAKQVEIDQAEYDAECMRQECPCRGN